jgi:hypothetical protein
MYNRKSYVVKTEVKIDKRFIVRINTKSTILNDYKYISKLVSKNYDDDIIISFK